MRTFDRKSIPMVAWYMLSNESYMNRVIKDVLPTTKDVRVRQLRGEEYDCCKILY